MDSSTVIARLPRLRAAVVVLSLSVGLVAGSSGAAHALQPPILQPGSIQVIAPVVGGLAGAVGGGQVAAGIGLGTLGTGIAVTGGAALIGLGGWYAYNAYIDSSQLQTDVAGAGTIHCVAPSWKWTNITSDICVLFDGTIGGKYQVTTSFSYDSWTGEHIQVQTGVRGTRGDNSGWRQSIVTELHGPLATGGGTFAEAYVTDLKDMSTCPPDPAGECNIDPFEAVYVELSKRDAAGNLLDSEWKHDVWFTAGTTEPVGTGTAERVTVGTLECLPWMGTVGDPLTVSEETPPYVAPPAGVEAPTPTMLCPEGYRPDSLTIDSLPYGSTTGPALNLVTWGAPVEWSDPMHQYANCLAAGAAPCELMLFRVTTNAGALVTCNQDPSPCAGWATHPSRESMYRCLWGEYTMTLNQCAAYERAFETTTPGELTETVTEAEPGAEPQPEPEPVLPQPTAGTDTTTGLEPDDGVDRATDVLGNPIDATEGRECFPQGWGLLNPVEWVLKPIMCGMEWAFVPSPATAARVDALGEALKTKAPVSYLVEVGTWVGGLDDVSAVACWNVDLDGNGHNGIGNIPVLDSCSDHAAIVWLRSKRGLLEVAMYVSMLVPLAWWAWGTYAPGSTGVA